MERLQYCYRKWAGRTILLVLSMVALCGCSHGPAAVTSEVGRSEQEIFELKEITPPQAMGLLSELALCSACVGSGDDMSVGGGYNRPPQRAEIWSQRRNNERRPCKAWPPADSV